MTISEAIKYCEEVAITQEEICKHAGYDHYTKLESSACAKEHRQLAEWLKDYKRLLEQEPCEDAISRAESIRIASGYCHPANIPKELGKLPSVQPEQKTGRWFIDERQESDREVICSNCDQPIFKYHKLDFDYRPKYCPNCGADMRGEKDE